MKRKASATVSEAEPQKTGETPTFGVTGQWPQRRVLQLPVTARLVRRNIWPIVASKGLPVPPSLCFISSMAERAFLS